MQISVWISTTRGRRNRRNSHLGSTTKVGSSHPRIENYISLLAGVYVKVSVRKIFNGRRDCKDLHKKIKLEVDGRYVELPPIEGIIILNIMSWGSGANIWGPEKDEKFTKPNHWDGMLEVVGVQGVVHLGKIQSGLRSAIRIVQGSHIKIHMNCEIPVQVDGEPWIQPAGDITVLRSALKVGLTGLQ